jgi:hypothetical protein
MDDLRSRAAALLAGSYPLTLGMNLTGLIRRYVASEPWDDPELRNQLSLCLQTAQTEAARFEGAMEGPARDARTFYQRAAAILQDIKTEVAAGRV